MACNRLGQGVHAAHHTLGVCSMSHGIAYGMVGFQAPAKREGSDVARDVMRALYREGKLSLAQAIAYAKPSDHGHAVATGKVDVAALASHGIDLHKAQTAYNRATGNGTVSAKRKASGSAASVEAKLLASDSSAALARLVEARKAKRQADKQAKQGKVYTQAEIAAIAATLAK